MNNDRQEKRDQNYASFSEDRGTYYYDEWDHRFYCYQAQPLREDSLCWDWDFTLVGRDQVIFEMKGGNIEI